MSHLRDRNRHRLLFTVCLTEGPAVFAGIVAQIQRRGIHNAQRDPILMNQSDVDCEFAVTLDEFLGAIQRVNEPEGFPVNPIFESDTG